jgi:alpha-ribazole phosphatase
LHRRSDSGWRCRCTSTNDCGEGRTAAELQQTDPVALGHFWRDPWRHPPPRGEPLNALQARVLSAWHDIASRGRPALLISHGGPLRMILSHLSGRPPERLLDIDVPLASLVRVALTAAVVASSHS